MDFEGRQWYEEENKDSSLMSSARIIWEKINMVYGSYYCVCYLASLASASVSGIEEGSLLLNELAFVVK